MSLRGRLESRSRSKRGGLGATGAGGVGRLSGNTSVGCESSENAKNFQKFGSKIKIFDTFQNILSNPSWERPLVPGELCLRFFGGNGNADSLEGGGAGIPVISSIRSPAVELTSFTCGLTFLVTGGCLAGSSSALRLPRTTVAGGNGACCRC